MNELHKQIRKDMEALLDTLIGDVDAQAAGIVGGHDDLSTRSILRLAIGGKTAALRKKVVAILTANREQELLALYQKKPELKAVGGK